MAFADAKLSVSRESEVYPPPFLLMVTGFIGLFL